MVGVKWYKAKIDNVPVNGRCVHLTDTSTANKHKAISLPKLCIEALVCVSRAMSELLVTITSTATIAPIASITEGK